MDETLGTKEVALRLGLHPTTVTRRRKKGELVAHEVSRGDGTFEWRYPVALLPPAAPAQARDAAPDAGPSADQHTALMPQGLLEEVRRLGALEATTTMQAMRIKELEAEVQALRAGAAPHVPWWRRLFGGG